MIWAVLVILGVPLWLCAVGIATLVLRNRALRTRQGNVAVRVLRPGRTRWTRGHAIWVSDVFAWRGSPAAWAEELTQVRGVTVRVPERAERKALHRLGDDLVVVVLSAADGGSLVVAAAGEDRAALSGPFGAPADTPVPLPRATSDD